MSDSSVDNKSYCMSSCEEQFTQCTKRMPSGCVEDLRRCRDTCRISQES